MVLATEDKLEFGPCKNRAYNIKKYKRLSSFFLLSNFLYFIRFMVQEGVRVVVMFLTIISMNM